MTKQSLKLGFIGGALDSAVGYAHFSACRMDNRWSIAAGCFSDIQSMNKETAKTYGVAPEKVYDNWQELVKKEKNNIDAVLIITPTPMHYKMARYCLEAGVPVICEKALSISSNEIENLKKVLQSKKGFLAVTYNYSGYPIIRELRSLIKNKKLGKLLHFQIEMPQEGYLRFAANGKKILPQQWRQKDYKVPTLYLDLAVHMHQLIKYLTDLTPLDVIASQKSYADCAGVIDNVISLCRYSENVEGQYWFSKSALGNRNGLKLRIYGTEASAEWLQLNPEELHISYNDGHRSIIDRASKVNIANEQRYTRFKAGHPAGYIEAFANLYTDIANCLYQYKNTGKKNAQHFELDTALEGLKMLEALTRSAKTNTWQKVKA